MPEKISAPKPNEEIVKEMVPDEVINSMGEVDLKILIDMSSGSVFRKNYPILNKLSDPVIEALFHNRVKEIYVRRNVGRAAQLQRADEIAARAATALMHAIRKNIRYLYGHDAF